MVANITGQKGHLELLPVIASVRSAVPDLQVWFIGRNELGSVLQERIAQLGLGKLPEHSGLQRRARGRAAYRTCLRVADAAGRGLSDCDHRSHGAGVAGGRLCGRRYS